MDESAISSVLSRLGGIDLSENKFLSDVPSKLKSMETKLRTVYAYLKDSLKKFEEGQLDRPDWLSEIKDVAYRYENCVEKIAWLQRRRTRKRGFIGTLSRYTQTLSDLKTLHHVDTEIDQINSKIPEISQIREQFSVDHEEGECSTGTNNESSIEDEWYQSLGQRTISNDEDIVLGLENDIVNEMLAHLTNSDHKELTSISIYGNSGIGKSSLAKEIFNHQIVKSNFSIYSWIEVSKNHQISDLLREILISTVKIEKEEVGKIKEEDARKLVFDFLKEKRYLIVLDEIWTTELWNDIFANDVTFPDMNDGSRIIFTTQSEEIGDNADIPHELEVLDNEKSWDLLKRASFRSNQRIDEEETLNDFENLGRELAEKCEGLPLALVILGGNLSKNLDLETWSKISSDLDSDEIETENKIEEIMAICYNDLPNYLKPCFLYAASFPGDNEIKVSKLIRLWIAEGFICPNETYTMEETARVYLNQLIERRIVQVIDLSKAHGWVNKIKIHDLLCQWGVKKARDEGFLDVWIGRDQANSSQNTLFYRLALHGFFHDELINLTFDLPGLVPNLRTLLTFDLPEINLAFQRLKFLRVLDLNGRHHIKRLPKWIKHMIHLRYLGLKDCGSIELPSTIRSLLNLTTFDATDTTIINLPRSFWSLPALKHVKIGTVKYSKMPNLGDPNGLLTLSLAVKSDGASKSAIISVAESLPSMSKLNSLFLLCTEEGIPIEAITSSAGNNHLKVLKLIGTLIEQTRLPNATLFPPNLVKLSLMFTGLSEDPLPILELLPNLVSLEMCDVYEGTSLNCTQHGFPKLKYLYLTMFLEVVEWNIENGAMASLSHLSLIQLVELNKMPEGFLHLTSLRKLEMVEMHGWSEESLEKLEENGCEVVQRDCLDQNVELMNTSGFYSEGEAL